MRNILFGLSALLFCSLFIVGCRATEDDCTEVQLTSENLKSVEWKVIDDSASTPIMNCTVTLQSERKAAWPHCSDWNKSYGGDTDNNGQINFSLYKYADHHMSFTKEGYSVGHWNYQQPNNIDDVYTIRLIKN